ncbi:GGDEF domain-containing protein [bacterium]|nr:GGDEF domain-containing protein [bacterium]
MHLLKKIVFPWIVLIAIIIGALSLNLFTQIPEKLYQPIGYTLILLITLLSMWFHKGKSFLIGLILTATFLSPWFHPYLWRLREWMQVSYPLTVFVILILPNRTPFGRGGLLRLLGITLFYGSFFIPFLIPFYTSFYTSLSATAISMTMTPHTMIALFSLPLIAIAALKQQSNGLAILLAFLSSALLIEYNPTPPTVVIIPLLFLIVGVLDSGYKMAFNDDLTSLPNRRALNEAMSSAHGTYALAMLDIDHFKKFNDTFGHDAGDDVLRKVSAHIGNVRGGGKAFRYGGEEFTILFQGKSAEDSLKYCEEVRENIAASPFIVRSKKGRKKPGKKGRKKSAPSKSVPVTISIGVADSRSQSGGPSEIIKKADKLLYKAKKGGRNRVEK